MMSAMQTTVVKAKLMKLPLFQGFFSERVNQNKSSWKWCLGAPVDVRLGGGNLKVVGAALVSATWGDMSINTDYCSKHALSSYLKLCT